MKKEIGLCILLESPIEINTLTTGIKSGDDSMFENAVSEFIYKRTYARWINKEKRREEWPETVDRFISFLKTERGL